MSHYTPFLDLSATYKKKKNPDTAEVIEGYWAGTHNELVQKNQPAYPDRGLETKEDTEWQFYLQPQQVEYNLPGHSHLQPALSHKDPPHSS